MSRHSNSGFDACSLASGTKRTPQKLDTLDRIWVQHSAVSPPSPPTPPLQEAVLAWVAAVEVVEQEALRIIRGGPVDRPRVAELLAAVETARMRCEQQAAKLSSDIEEGAL